MTIFMESLFSNYGCHCLLSLEALMLILFTNLHKPEVQSINGTSKCKLFLLSKATVNFFLSVLTSLATGL